jgi:branched-chain amino acid transport system permease protein
VIQAVNQTINGVLIGLLYSLVAMGFVVIYRASKVFNFAQGEFVVLGAFLIWSFVLALGLPVVIGLPAALIAAAAAGWLIERVFFSRLVGEPVFSMVMVTIALLILIRGVILIVWGPEVRPFPIIFSLRPIIIGGVLMQPSLLFGGFLTIGIAFGLSWFFNHSRIGLALTAVSEDHQIAQSLGISVRKAMVFAWVLGSVLSTLGAMIYLNGKSLNFLASDIGFTAFPVALLAGLESIAGLIPAGILVGIIQTLTQYYLDPMFGSNAASILPSLAILIILFIRPTGLFGWMTIERV